MVTRPFREVDGRNRLEAESTVGDCEIDRDGVVVDQVEGRVG